LRDNQRSNNAILAFGAYGAALHFDYPGT